MTAISELRPRGGGSSRTAPPALNVRGSLQQASLPSVLQLLTRLHASGCLRLWRGAWAGELGLDDGHVTAARADSETGLRALEFLVSLAVGGEFAFVAGSPPGDSDPALGAHLPALLARAATLPLLALPSPTAVPRRADPLLDRPVPTQVPLQAGALKTLLAVDGQRSVRQIADRRGQLRAVQELAWLDQLQLITYDSLPGEVSLAEPESGAPELPETALPAPALSGNAGSLVAAAPAATTREIFRRFWPYARPFRLWIALSLLVVAAMPAVDAATIWLYGLLVDQVLIPRTFDRFPPIVLAYLSLTVIGGVVSFLDDFLSTWIGQRFLLALRTSFFRHLMKLPLDFFERQRLGDVLTRLTDDIASIETFVVGGLADVLTYGLTIVFFVGALFYIQWQLALLSLLVVPLFWFLASHFSGLIKDAARERRQRSGSLTAVAEESLSNVALVQAYNRQALETERFWQQAFGGFRAQMSSTRLRALFSPLIELVELGGVLLVVGAGTWELAQGQVSLGGLLVFLGYLARLYSPIRSLSKFSNTLHSAAAAAERIIELLDRQPEVIDRPDAVALKRARGLVVFDAVSFG